ncbi:hypothetical protein BDK51DRAFT_49676 [Blyttiomyces helicus]|uniref:F-box domain-containing protein n=1 Tax=Blyttiomyces helicus TaxID=388810 RepID=A0A4P9VVT8_9FUNG|nr:hypothetical protein BDK51DRAFT_49676 [Blyttiomyces helicus]|eukprot:RKO83789.1 hypothetical protein BDK51DRAFT_49676 [Blyttiomyces helicus]
MSVPLFKHFNKRKRLLFPYLYLIAGVERQQHSKFPRELVRMVLQYLQNSSRPATAIVCRAWKPVPSELLWRWVLLPTPHALKKFIDCSRLTSYRVGSKPGASLVRTLVLTVEDWSEVPPSAFLQFIPQLRGLEALLLKSARCAPTIPMIEAFLTSGPALMVLETTFPSGETGLNARGYAPRYRPPPAGVERAVVRLTRLKFQGALTTMRSLQFCEQLAQCVRAPIIALRAPCGALRSSRTPLLDTGAWPYLSWVVITGHDMEDPVRELIRIRPPFEIAVLGPMSWADPGPSLILFIRAMPAELIINFLTNDAFSDETLAVLERHAPLRTMKLCRVGYSTTPVLSSQALQRFLRARGSLLERLDLSHYPVTDRELISCLATSSPRFSVLGLTAAAQTSRSLSTAVTAPRPTSSSKSCPGRSASASAAWDIVAADFVAREPAAAAEAEQLDVAEEEVLLAAENEEDASDEEDELAAADQEENAVPERDGIHLAEDNVLAGAEVEEEALLLAEEALCEIPWQPVDVELIGDEYMDVDPGENIAEDKVMDVVEASAEVEELTEPFAFDEAFDVEEMVMVDQVAVDVDPASKLLATITEKVEGDPEDVSIGKRVSVCVEPWPSLRFQVI